MVVSVTSESRGRRAVKRFRISQDKEVEVFIARVRRRERHYRTHHPRRYPRHWHKVGLQSPLVGLLLLSVSPVRR